MPVRNAGPEDLDEICNLIDELAAYEHLEAEVVYDRREVGRRLFGEDPPARVLLAVTESEDVVGMALWLRTYSSFLGAEGIWLEDLFVRPAHRGRGHGLALLMRLRELTTGRLEWAVLDWNTSAVEFYRRLGAQPVDGWTRYRWLP